MSEGEEEDAAADGNPHDSQAVGDRTGVFDASWAPPSMCLHDLGFLTWGRAHSIAGESEIANEASRQALVSDFWRVDRLFHVLLVGFLLLKILSSGR